MGTYTANYQLYMPTVGEQGWGDLMNGNLTTIDTTMKGLNTRIGTAETNITSLTSRMGTAETTIASNKSRIGTLETEADAFDSRITTLEAGEFSGSVTADKFNGYIVSDYILTQEKPAYTNYLVCNLSAVTKSATYQLNETACTVTTDLLTNKPLNLGVVGGKFKGCSLTLNITFSIEGTWQTDSYARVNLNGTTIANCTYLASSGNRTDTVTVDLVEGDNVFSVVIQSYHSKKITATISAIKLYAEQYIP